MADKKDEKKEIPEEKQVKKDVKPETEKDSKENQENKSEIESKVEDALSGFDLIVDPKSEEESKEILESDSQKPTEAAKSISEKKAKSEAKSKSEKTEEKVEKSEEESSEEKPQEDRKKKENSKAKEDKASDNDKEGEEHHEEYEFDEDEEHDHDEEEDYDKLSKEELLERIKEITGRDVLKVSEKRIEAINEAFHNIIEHDREDALQEFLKEEENKEEDFEYQKDKDLIQQFKTYYDGFKDKKRQAHHDLNRLKDENLKKKEELLERLRQFVDEDEDNVSIKTLKDIETEWKEAEPIPNNYTRELWANFNALRDRFYDKRSIFYELKELDRKKNENLKKEVIERAKELLSMNPVNAAVAELKKLHEEYKHIGPVPREIRPVLWEEFKSISDKVHERKQAVSAEFKKKLDENLEKKKELIKKLEALIDFSSEKISEWNEKSKEIQTIQSEWKSLGPVPREISKEISKSFWSHFKSFFKSKQQFFKKLDESREKNYEEKIKLIERVEDLNKTAEDFSKHSEEVKKLQREWKKIGPAPRKKSEEVYKRFKEVCDEFFDNLRGKQKELEKDYEKNLEKKNEIVEKLKGLKKLTEDNIEKVEEMVKEWTELGFVPRKAIKSSKNAISEAIDSLIKNAGEFKDESIDVVETKLKAILMKSDFRGSRNIGNQIDKIRRHISKLQDNTVNLKNNMEFFASTKNAEKLKDDVQQKIDAAEEEIQKLKDKVKMLRQIDRED